MNARRWRGFGSGVALATGILLGFGQTREAQPKERSEAWARVEAAAKVGLPQTAARELEPILTAALESGAYPEAVKALVMKIGFERLVQGRQAEELIFRLENDMNTMPDRVQPVLRTILANGYWQYFRQNRHRFVRRTRTAEPPGDDFLTWDLPRILAEVDAHFTAALADEQALRAIPIAEYDVLIEKGSVPDPYRPTLFDFLAHEALAFYTAGEQGAIRAEDAFTIASDHPILAPADEFLSWRPEPGQTASPTLKAIGLFQRLMLFHRQGDDPSAFLDVNLQRLRFGLNVSVGDDRDERYREALRQFMVTYGNHPLSARARFRLADSLHRIGEAVEAHRIATVGRDDFPDTPGGTECFNLVEQIESKSVSMQTEQVWNPPRPDIEITYRNIDQVYFRAVAFDIQEKTNAAAAPSRSTS